MRPYRFEAVCEHETPTSEWMDGSKPAVMQRISANLIFRAGTGDDGEDGEEKIHNVLFELVILWEQKSGSEWIRCGRHTISWWEETAEPITKASEFYPFFPIVNHGLKDVTPTKVLDHLNRKSTEATGRCPSLPCVNAVTKIKQIVSQYVAIIEGEAAAK